jgi:hypothetical protein
VAAGEQGRVREGGGTEDKIYSTKTVPKDPLPSISSHFLSFHYLLLAQIMNLSTESTNDESELS